ncbi:universal stress protein [Mycobacterium tuberculosis]|nr:universal stress protein [Mycobacterium tuberculosis]
MSSGNSSLGIIVGIDDSPAAQVAVRWAARDSSPRHFPMLDHPASENLSASWGLVVKVGSGWANR